MPSKVSAERAIEKIEAQLAAGFYKNKHTEQVTRVWLNRLKTGLCVRCGIRAYATGKQRCQECLDSGQIDSKLRQHKRIKSGSCVLCNDAPVPGRRFCKRHAEIRSETGIRRYQEIKTEVFNAYGGPKCACCGETIVHFLSMDHVENNGAAHRKETGFRKTWASIFLWLKKHGFPPGFQVLCMNCNFGKARNGGICPHKQKETYEQIQ